MQPGSIDWGTLPYNYERRAHITLRNLTPGGRLIGTARIAPEHEGITLQGAIDGERDGFQLTLNTSSFRAGELYIGSIHAETNSGVYSVPIRFQIELAWRRVAMWAAGFSALFAALFGAARLLFADWIPDARDWTPLPPDQPESAGLASLLFIGFVVLVFGVRWAYTKSGRPSQADAHDLERDELLASVGAATVAQPADLAPGDDIDVWVETHTGSEEAD